MGDYSQPKHCFVYFKFIGHANQERKVNAVRLLELMWLLV